MSRFAYALVIAALTAVLGHAAVVGQAPAAVSSDSGKGAVIGTGTFTGFVENMVV